MDKEQFISFLETKINDEKEEIVNAERLKILYEGDYDSLYCEMYGVSKGRLEILNEIYDLLKNETFSNKGGIV